MFRQFVYFASASLLLAQAPFAVPKVLLKSETKCIIRVEASTQLTVMTAAPGRVAMNQECSLTLPGRMEEWEEPDGSIDFRFFPDATAGSLEGRFKTQAHEVKPMEESQVLIEGNTILGMGTWFFHADAFGKDITVLPRDVSAVGQVTASTHSTLTLGEKQSVLLKIVPRIERDFPPAKQPLIHFPKGADLWALRSAQAPLSVTGVVRFEHSGSGQEAKGTARITFELTPKVPSAK